MIVDNLSVHHGKNILKPWLQKHKHEIFYLTSYSPELNPDEYFNGTVKRTLEHRGDSQNLKQFNANLHSTILKIQRNEQHLRNLYNAEEISYAL